MTAKLVFASLSILIAGVGGATMFQMRHRSVNLKPVIKRSDSQTGERMTVEQITKLMADNIPSDANKDIVLKFLSDNKINHFGYKEENAVEFVKESGVMPTFYQEEKLKDKWQRIKYQIGAKIPSSGKGSGEGWPVNIWLHIYFDKDDKLIEYLIREVEHSP